MKCLCKKRGFCIKRWLLNASVMIELHYGCCSFGNVPKAVFNDLSGSYETASDGNTSHQSRRESQFNICEEYPIVLYHGPKTLSPNQQ